MVGLGRIELPTSPLSGVRSSQLSYSGGAGRDRTGDLLSANQALSQLSYSPSKNHKAECLCYVSITNHRAGTSTLKKPHRQECPCYKKKAIEASWMQRPGVQLPA